MNYLEEIIGEFELHSPEGIRRCFENGVDPNATYHGEPLINQFTSEYPRTPRFKDCIRLFVDFGLRFEDRALLAVLLDDANLLKDCLQIDHSLISGKYSMRCAYTPLYEVSLLHICAEFNHTACAGLLIGSGADVNATAGFDEWGFGGHTPIFHTVNQNSNNSAGMMELLLDHSADLSTTVPGLIWGRGYEWETLIPSVNPISYAMMGLLPQMHRGELTVSGVVSKLLKHRYGIDYISQNLPNAYLRK